MKTVRPSVVLAIFLLCSLVSVASTTTTYGVGRTGIAAIAAQNDGGKHKDKDKDKSPIHVPEPGSASIMVVGFLAISAYLLVARRKQLRR